MKKAILLFLFAGIAYAQSPQLNVKGTDSEQVRMNKLLVNVKVVGNIAYTTTEMHFFNSGTRDMEAELLFPLPEGVSVSRYAIDINGKIREAVPVNKNKGKQIYEAIIHRRVDPGLLEKVAGNNFKTRIYPITPNGERIVIIGYEQELSYFDAANLSYQLVSSYPKKLDHFELNISIAGATSKPTIISENEEITLENWNQNFQASVKKTNYLPMEKLLVKIPVKADIPSVVVETVKGQHFFYANTSLSEVTITKKAPASIGIIWDNSLSCKNRDLQKELEVLDNYFKNISNTVVTLYELNYNFKKVETFTISNGNWETLKTKLQNTIYDGGTRYSKINFPPHDEYLFFTDGLSTLSENTLQNINKPLYTITSAPSADFAFLNYAVLKSKGSFINLNKLTVIDAVNQLTTRNLKFLGIKENHLVTDIYPSVGTTVSGSFSVTGISLLPINVITLLFGYDEASIERQITIDVANQSENIEKLWAQKKIADLEIQYQKNAEEIEIMGKRYGIITQNTSLIVLEDINDYVQYEVVPPTELLEEYNRIKKQQQDTNLAKQQSNWDNVEDYFTKLNNWWKTNKKFVANKTSIENISKKIRINNEVSEVAFDSPDTVSAVVEEVKISSTESNSVYASPPPAHANIIEEDDIDVNFYSRSETLKQVDSKPNSPTNNESNKGLISNLIFEDKSESNEKNQRNENRTILDSISNNRLRPTSDRKTIEVQEWNPDRVYLKALAAVPFDKRYDLYLQLRENNLLNPNYYFDVAQQFYNNGNREKALLVLSNIADLGLENHQLYKSLTYVFRQWKAYEDALFTAREVAKWRAHEPQSHRDLALTLEDNKKYQEGFDELIKALEINYYEEMSGQYQGVEDIILMDLNRMISEHKGLDSSKLDKKYLSKMPIGIRIILNWNQMDTDIDLHVIEPTGENCYYGNTNTEIGARFSKDFTQGYGPEQYLLRNTVKGKYQIKTNYFGETTLTESGPATVLVEIYITKPNGKIERTLKTVQLGKIKENQNIAVVTVK